MTAALRACTPELDPVGMVQSMQECTEGKKQHLRFSIKRCKATNFRAQSLHAQFRCDTPLNMGTGPSKYNFQVINFSKEIKPVEGHDGSVKSMYPRIGSGGYGTVYVGMYRGEKIAFKVFHKEMQGDLDKAQQEEWCQSMEMLCSLDHPNLIKNYGVCIQKGHRALVMQFANKGNLFSWIHVKKQSLSEGMILKTIRAVAKALVYLHERKIMHRDIKSENILIHQDGNHLDIKIADFDLTQSRGDDSVVETVRGRGTLNYAAPELYTPPASINEKVDIFSVAMVAYECVSRQIPWYNTPELTIINMVSNHGKRPQIPATCSTPLRNLIEQCWDQKPANRPSAKELEQMCDKLLEMRRSKQDLAGIQQSSSGRMEELPL
eukprot:TRINITY_DN8104_c1_g1_i2.p2 TRINITY_DN8104_c1_g1~~TRINITY_DN8104_c1_g1_i2.p2  ORF type:complete len:378 (+),score=40.27 TRINITY_DN8104_c1_g1_i2:135-1268(+)